MTNFHHQYAAYIKKVLSEFLMVTMYDNILNYYKCLKHIYLLLKAWYYPIVLCKVYYKDKHKEIDVMQDFCSKSNFDDIYQEKVIHVEWSFKDIDYCYYFNTSDENHIKFPPYTLEELKTAKPNVKLAAVTINNDDSIFDLVKMYAGPMHNFYNKSADMSKIFDKDVKSTIIIDTKGKFYEFEEIVNFNNGL